VSLDDTDDASHRARAQAQLLAQRQPIRPGAARERGINHCDRRLSMNLISRKETAGQCLPPP
jgi:hypothetical protein